MERPTFALPVLPLYTLTVLTSAFLLFGVQPLAGRLLLPVLGGVPGAWTACLLFFQTALLLGYGWGEALSRVRSLRARIGLHIGLVLIPLAVLPPVPPDEASLGISPSTSPTLFALAFLARSIGLPFFALSTTAPMLQSFFARTDHPAAARPYFLYAASNAGSLGSLLAYPFVIEPLLGLTAQSHAFGIGYAVLVVLVVLCGAVTARRPRSFAEGTAATPTAVDEAPTRAVRMRWLLFALVPSALLSSVTTYLSLDLAPIPLLWVLPLAAYLGTFIVTFGGGGREMPAWVSRVARLLGVVLVVATLVHANSPLWLLVLLHFAFFVLASLVSHGRLAKLAPAPVHLTEFYVWMALGGALGTFLTSVVATHVLPDLWEYPLAIAAGCGVTAKMAIPGMSQDAPTPGMSRADLVSPIVVLVIGLGLLFAVGGSVLGTLPFAALLVFGPLAILAYRTSPRPRRYALALLSMILVGTLYRDHGATLLRRERGFFGVLRVVDDGAYRVLLHGSTLHGSQAIRERELCEPLAYYTRSGPLGRAISARRAAIPGAIDAAIIGLGAGAIACYAAPGERWTFHEINADVVDVATDPTLFTFVDNARGEGATIDLVVGDGRQGLLHTPPGSVDLVMVDAFNSDSVPIHLLTREAVRVYLRALADDGWLLLHISNRTLNLTRVVSAIAEAEHLSVVVNGDATEIGGARAAQTAAQAGIPGTSDGASPTWVVIARTSESLDPLRLSAGFIDLAPPRGAPAWTDERASLFEVIRR